MGIFEQYGIREVANLTFYSIETDENDELVYVPVLFLDSLKLSDLEEKLEQTSARGGRGNSELVIWDHSKELTLSVEDALFTPASFSLMWSNLYKSKTLELQGIFKKEKVYLPSRAIIKNFSDFWIEIDEEKGKVYNWLTNLQIISLDGTVRHNLEKVEIFYYKIKGKSYWGFPNDISFGDGIFTLSQDKNSSIRLPMEIIYSLENGIKPIKTLERLEQCVAKKDFVIEVEKNYIHNNYRYLRKYEKTDLVVYIDPQTMLPYEDNVRFFIKENGERYPKQGFKRLRLIKKDEIYYRWTRLNAPKYKKFGNEFEVCVDKFAGTYKVVGETLCRDAATHTDSHFQIEIPKCKIIPKNKLSLSSNGEATVFSMDLKVLKDDFGNLIKFRKYDCENEIFGENISSSLIPIQKDCFENGISDTKIEEKWLTPQELNWGIEVYPDESKVIGLKIDTPENDSNFYILDRIYWAEEENDEYEGAVNLKATVSNLRTQLLVLTIDGEVQWNGDTPEFVYDENNNIQTRLIEVSRDVKNLYKGGEGSEEINLSIEEVL